MCERKWRFPCKQVNWWAFSDDALLKQYKDPGDQETLKSLNMLCVRLVFCLYAEDAGIFGGHGMFHNSLQAHQSEARRALIDLFKVLDTKPEDRDPYMDDDLAAFPYVNGGLFANESIIIPRLDEAIVDLIPEPGQRRLRLVRNLAHYLRRCL